MSLSKWRPISEAPKDGEFLATNGVLLGVGVFYRTVEADWKYLGYDEGSRFPDGSPKIGPRFTERVPNPKAGEVREWFYASAFHAFDGKSEVQDYDGPIGFTPTHFMELPDPPS